MLKVVSLSKSYRSAQETVDVLRGVDLAVARGESVALTGESGSGKSTLLRLIAGLEEPSGGRIVLGAFDLRDRMDGWIDRLAAFRPDTIVAPPKVLRLLAEAGRLDAADRLADLVVKVAGI